MRLSRLADDILPRLDVPIRRLGHADRSALIEFHRRLSPADRSAQFGHPLSDDRLALFVHRLNFEADGHFAALGAASLIIGVAHCTAFDGQAILSVQVASRYRRRGVGSALVREAMAYGHLRALAWTRAYFRKSDPIAAALARGCGMRLHVGLDRFHAERRFEAPEPQGGGRSPDGDRSAAATEVVVAG